MRNSTASLVLLTLVSLCVPAQGALPEGDAERAINRALPVLTTSATVFVEKRACFSCHHNALPILTLHLARERGFAVDEMALSKIEAKTFVTLRGGKALDDAIQAVNLNDPTPDDSLLLMAAGAASLPRDLTTEVIARRLASWQRDGHWVTSDFRPPHSSSLFTATATAIRAIALYMPPELAADREAVFARARAWLMATKPQSTEDAVFRLAGLTWASAPAADLEAARRGLLAMQTPSGGWSQLRGYPADAYSTGEVLYALHESGVSAVSAAWRRGRKFLLSTQAADGTWHVTSRMVSPAEVSPRYFTTGFPHEKDEYLSYAGTSWAVMALLSALPEKVPAPALSPSADTAAPWLRTALFGSREELRRLLESGTSPNAETPSGTTLLMAAAPDADKVRFLLARGADPAVRARSGFDAVTIAASYRGTADSIELLLAAGASAEPPAGTRVKNTPLVMSSMAGDLANVKLLLAIGADPSAASQSNTPIATAIMFGYPDVVRALIKAGANAGITEGTGINLIHWAAITGHADVIPILAETRVPINAKDENGYTPLMYAATIDFGNTEVLQSLLKSGADRAIKNDEGRTPLQQARFYHHTRLAELLK